MSLPSSTELSAMASAGGWVVAVAMAVMIIGLIVVGQLVPGWIYKAEVEWRKQATEATARTVEAMEHLSGNIETLIKQGPRR